MNLKDKILYGYLTTKEFSNMIDGNVSMAKILNYRIWWVMENKGIVGRISHNDTLLFEKIYDNDYMHVMLSKMHYDWTRLLVSHIQLKNDEEYRQQMDAKEALGGQNYEQIDTYSEDNSPTLGEKIQMQREKEFANKKYGIT